MRCGVSLLHTKVRSMSHSAPPGYDGGSMYRERQRLVVMIDSRLCQ